MKHHSKYTNRLIGDPQKLAEFVVERKYKNIKLPEKFWSDERYKRDFALQLRFANQLLKLYPFQAILNALNSKGGQNTYSLGAKWLDPICKQEEEKILVKKISKELNLKERNQDAFEMEYLNRPIDKTGEKHEKINHNIDTIPKKQNINSIVDRLGDL